MRTLTVSWVSALPLLVALAVLAACGTTDPSPRGEPADAPFDCREREATIAYWPHSLAIYDNWRTTLTCRRGPPRIVGSRVVDAVETDAEMVLAPAEFESLWKEVAASGWRDAPEACHDPARLGDGPTFEVNLGEAGDHRKFDCKVDRLGPPLEHVTRALEQGLARVPAAAWKNLPDTPPGLDIPVCDEAFRDLLRCNDRAPDGEEKRHVRFNVLRVARAWRAGLDAHELDAPGLLATCEERFVAQAKECLESAAASPEPAPTGAPEAYDLRPPAPPVVPPGQEGGPLAATCRKIAADGTNAIATALGPSIGYANAAQLAADPYGGGCVPSDGTHGTWALVLDINRTSLVPDAQGHPKGCAVLKVRPRYVFVGADGKVGPPLLALDEGEWFRGRVGDGMSGYCSDPDSDRPPGATVPQPHFLPADAKVVDIDADGRPDLALRWYRPLDVARELDDRASWAGLKTPWSLYQAPADPFAPGQALGPLPTPFPIFGWSEATQPPILTGLGPWSYADVADDSPYARHESQHLGLPRVAQFTQAAKQPPTHMESAGSGLVEGSPAARAFIEELCRRDATPPPWSITKPDAKGQRAADRALTWVECVMTFGADRELIERLVDDALQKVSNPAWDAAWNEGHVRVPPSWLGMAVVPPAVPFPAPDAKRAPWFAAYARLKPGLAARIAAVHDAKLHSADRHERCKEAGLRLAAPTLAAKDERAILAALLPVLGRKETTPKQRREEGWGCLYEMEEAGAHLRSRSELRTIFLELLEEDAEKGENVPWEMGSRFLAKAVTDPADYRDLLVAAARLPHLKAGAAEALRFAARTRAPDALPAFDRALLTATEPAMMIDALWDALSNSARPEALARLTALLEDPATSDEIRRTLENITFIDPTIPTAPLVPYARALLPRARDAEERGFALRCLLADPHERPQAVAALDAFVKEVLADPKRFALGMRILVLPDAPSEAAAALRAGMAAQADAAAKAFEDRLARLGRILEYDHRHTWPQAKYRASLEAMRAMLVWLTADTPEEHAQRASIVELAVRAHVPSSELGPGLRPDERARLDARPAP